MHTLCTHYRTQEPFELLKDGGKVHLSPASGKAREANGELIVAPGLVDLQLNGFVGIDLNKPKEISLDDIEAVVAAQWRLGVTHFLPTVTTNSFEHMKEAMEKLVQAMDRPDLGSSLPGIHMEGPYISPEDGPRGAHPLEHTRPPSWDEFQRIQDAVQGKICLVTLSPEYPEALEFIPKLVENNVIAAIGHTNASPEQIRDAVKAGASLSTHLGNGSHAQIRRHPNYIWEQLGADELTATLIVDGHHLPPAVAKSMIRAKQPERVILISDAVSVAGLEPGRYNTLGMEVELTTDGAVRLAGTPYLAGAALKLPDAIVNTVRFAGTPLETAIDMASTHAVEFLDRHTNVQLSSLDDGSFVVFKKEGANLSPVLTAVDGDVVFQADE